MIHECCSPHRYSLLGEFGTWPGQGGEAHPTDLVRWDFALFWSERSAPT